MVCDTGAHRDRREYTCPMQEKIEEEILERTFIPYYEEKKHICGEWKKRCQVLFPGYVFLVTDKVELLFHQLKKVIGLTKLLGDGTDIIPLTEDEVAFMKNLGGEKQIVAMSEGIIEGTQVMIHSGPLAGLEGNIRRIDRHKRKAWVEMKMFGRMQLVQVGLEIVAKYGEA